MRRGVRREWLDRNCARCLHRQRCCCGHRCQRRPWRHSRHPRSIRHSSSLPRGRLLRRESSLQRLCSLRRASCLRQASCPPRLIDRPCLNCCHSRPRGSIGRPRGHRSCQSPTRLAARRPARHSTNTRAASPAAAGPSKRLSASSERVSRQRCAPTSAKRFKKLCDRRAMCGLSTHPTKSAHWVACSVVGALAASPRCCACKSAWLACSIQTSSVPHARACSIRKRARLPASRLRLFPPKSRM